MTRSLHYGGAERQLATLAKGLRLQGHQVEVLVFYGHGPLERELHKAGIPVTLLGKAGRWDTIGFVIRLMRAVRDRHADVLHTYLDAPNMLAVLVKPFVFQNTKIVWGVRASNVDFRHYNWLLGIIFRVNCFFSRFADLIIVNSHAGQIHHLRHGYPESKTVVVPNGVDTDHFKPCPDGRKKVRAELGIGNHEQLVGLVGRLDPMKDHQSFLHAAALLNKEKADLRFLCVGGGGKDYERELKELAQQLGLSDCVIWSAPRDDMADVYNAVDIVVSSSSYGEGFSNVIGEAMACGTPCVVTDVGDSAWIVGDVGKVVPPNDYRLLAKAIDKLLQDLAEGVAPCNQKVRERIVGIFSREILVGTTTKLLTNISR